MPPQTGIHIQTHTGVHTHTSTQTYGHKQKHIVQKHTNTYRHNLQRDTLKCTYTYRQTHPQAHTDTDGHTYIWIRILDTYKCPYIDTYKFRHRNTQIKTKTHMYACIGPPY